MITAHEKRDENPDDDDESDRSDRLLAAGAIQPIGGIALISDTQIEARGAARAFKRRSN